MNPKVSLQRSGPGARLIAAQLASISKIDVLVGIPETKASRRKGQINNAELMYIHTHGSPARNIPPRPVIEPAIANDEGPITLQLEQALQSVLEEQPQQALAPLNAAGLEARNACIRWFDDPNNGWPPNKPSTITAKGSSHPLVDTGQLKRSITYVVTEKE